MNQIEAAVEQYEKTILDLSTRLANAAAELFAATEALKERDAEIAKLKARKVKAETKE